MSDRVIIWTRLTYDTTGTVDINWTMATDTGMTDVVTSGAANTSSAVDWTLKIDVDGLEEDSWYYYQFDFQGRKSSIGRTKTAPTGDTDSLRFAVVSCSNYELGYFNVYKELPTRNDLDAVIHLGDYFYEYGVTVPLVDREVEPTYEILSLEDYRTRYSHYRLDKDLQFVHQQYPMINVWDDHESANDSWYGGAENHTEGTEGAWVDRKAYAQQAWNEWLPARLPDPASNDKIYRRIRYGDLLDILMMDTRLTGRDEQLSPLDAAIGDSARSLLGNEQRAWLMDALSDTTTQWKVLGQQVMVAPIELFGVALNADQWDGYPAERQRVYDHIMDNDIEDVVVITGDIHSSWANDLPLPDYDPATGDSSVAVEFVTTSVTSTAIPIAAAEPLIMAGNPHIKYINLVDRGFVVLDINKTRAQGDWVYVSTVFETDYTINQGPSWYVNDQERHLQEATSPLEAPTTSQDLAPVSPPNPPLVSRAPDLNFQEDMVLVGAYPNPFMEKVQLQFHLYRPHKITYQIVDATGKVVFEQYAGRMEPGLHYAQIDGLELGKGTYFLILKTENQVWKRNLLKIE